MNNFKNKHNTPTSTEFFNSVEDKDSYYWKSRGVHVFNVLRDWEQGNKKVKNRK